MYSEILEQPVILQNMHDRLKSVLAKIAVSYKKNKPKYIVTASRGSSSNACMYFKYLSEIFAGLPCNAIYPSVYTRYGSNMNLSDSICIGVSQSGKAADAIKVLETAKKAGSITIAITNDENSPMAKTAEFHLYLGAGLEKSVAATKTFTAQMYALFLLIKTLSNYKIEDSDIKSGIEKVIKQSSDINELANSLIKLDHAFVLGRSFCYPTALEAGLKLQETTYTKAQSFASSDFHHGPFAMIDNTAIVFLIMPKSAVYKDLYEIKDKCEALGAKTIVITDCEKTKGTAGTIKISGGNDCSTPFYAVTAMQLFANSLSVAKGLNPDTPRGLNKITITM